MLFPVLGLLGYKSRTTKAMTSVMLGGGGALRTWDPLSAVSSAEGALSESPGRLPHPRILGATFAGARETHPASPWRTAAPYAITLPQLAGF